MEPKERGRACHQQVKTAAPFSPLWGDSNKSLMELEREGKTREPVSVREQLATLLRVCAGDEKELWLCVPVCC